MLDQPQTLEDIATNLVFDGHDPELTDLQYETALVTKVLKEVRPKRPKHWDKWSVERQLGYTMAISDLEKNAKRLGVKLTC